jgi:hypothetical protein
MGGERCVFYAGGPAVLSLIQFIIADPWDVTAVQQSAAISSQFRKFVDLIGDLAKAKVNRTGDSCGARRLISGAFDCNPAAFGRMLDHAEVGSGRSCHQERGN